jgi:5-methylcytosine-specific restriction endonuclease McrA
MNKIPENRRRAILAAHRDKCVYCDQSILSKNLHIDHILPKSLAGGFQNEVQHFVID